MALSGQGLDHCSLGFVDVFQASSVPKVFGKMSKSHWILGGRFVFEDGYHGTNMAGWKMHHIEGVFLNM